jgi:hypothetical protein
MMGNEVLPTLRDSAIKVYLRTISTNALLIYAVIFRFDAQVFRDPVVLFSSLRL